MENSANRETGEKKGARQKGSFIPSGEERDRLLRIRFFKDRIARYGVGAGGGGVVFALALMFIYLFYEVMPLFISANITEIKTYGIPGDRSQNTLMIAMERYGEMGVRFIGNGKAVFFEIENGKIRKQETLPIPDGAYVTSFGKAESHTGIVVYGLSNGTAVVTKHEYDLSYPKDKRYIDPKLTYPLGKKPVVIDERGQALREITVQQGPKGIAVSAATQDNHLKLIFYQGVESFITGEMEYVRSFIGDLPAPSNPISYLLVDGTMKSLFAGDAKGNLHYYDIGNPDNAKLMENKRVMKNKGASITAMNFLLGSVSIIVGGSDGSISQWFLVRDSNNIHHITHVRDFDPHSAAVTTIAPEYTRKGFLTGSDNGEIGIHYSTSSVTLLQKKVSELPVVDLALSPVNNALLVNDAENNLRNFELVNLHPEISFSALWKKVWYEDRGRPEYIWQSSSGTDDFEAKFSLVPLSIGTLKAAFFAMLFAMPLSIMGAIYTAYFMARQFRGWVKPTIEIMEALPTVILGFLAGLWLAPFVENNLPAVFGIFTAMPFAMLILAFLWHKLPLKLKYKFPTKGWEAAWLIPVILLVGWIAVSLSPVIEVLFFNGSMRQWLTNVGITYDQRNALVVGIAMGFAVIPTIFSIAEDAIFNVPKHLTQGSLALGATQWQTVTRIVLHTASPGIFSGLMIGFGRAVGETMIVLMATGNSPVVNFNIFEGMRTLSANIAVELPETAVNSSHYRVLFLAALLLFLATFLVNTVAEVVRQRLRRKYASL